MLIHLTTQERSALIHKLRYDLHNEAMPRPDVECIESVLFKLISQPCDVPTEKDLFAELLTELLETYGIKPNPIFAGGKHDPKENK